MKKRKNVEEKRPVVASAAVLSLKLGELSVHANVLGAIARKVVFSIEGVAELAGGSWVGNIAEMIGSKLGDRPITVSISDNQVYLAIKLNVYYGYSIPELSTRLQKAVAAEIKSLAGLNISTVDIVINSVKEKDAS